MTESNKRPQLKVSSPNSVPGHSMYADWALPGRKYSYISLVDLVLNIGHGRKPRVILHEQICAKPGNWYGTSDFAGPRYEAADPRYPGILIAGMPNPCELPFRMVDGRRRLHKLRQLGIKESPFFVFEYTETLPFIFDFELID